MTDWDSLQRAIVRCSRCPRLRAYCQQVARVKRRAYADQTYWARPITGFGDHGARVWIIGLAPGAHGANRTGRVFTGDRSGDFLYAALHRAGLANQPTSVHREDGLELRDVFVSAAARCAPPGNRPTKLELERCAGYLDAEWGLLRNKRVILALGAIAWGAALELAARQGALAGHGGRPAFAHAAELPLGGVWLLGSYHVSQQNTFTGRLTEAMFDCILMRAIQLAAKCAAVK